MTSKNHVAVSASQSFDPSLYVRPPVLNIASAITLGQTLAKHCPADAPATVKKQAKALDQAAAAALTAWTDRQRSDVEIPALSGAQKLQLDVLTDQGWGALRQNLESHALVPADRSKKSEPAQGLLARLFPDGLSFLKRPYVEQLAVMDSLLARIDADGLAKQIDAICGAEFLANIRQNQRDYRAMVQAPSGVPLELSLSDVVRAVGEAVVDYAIAVCATVDRKDPGSLRWARQLLQPIDDLREQQQRRSNPDPATPPTPPEPPPETP